MLRSHFARVVAVLSCAALVALAGCASTTQSRSVVLTFDGQICHYEGPKVVTEGDVTITLVNNTKLDASLWMVRLDDGKTWQDMLDYIGPPGSHVEPPRWSSAGFIIAPVPDKPNAKVYSLKKGLIAIACCTCGELSGPRGVWPGAALEVKAR
jgi:hypothetical protein